MEIKRHINYALVEDVRPPMYTAMKYWGKKPHNIWREFIECYSPEGGIVLDPFAGSGIAAFEGAIAKRKTIALDINPMTSFFIEVSTAKFDADLFTKAATSIIEAVKKDPVYLKHYTKHRDGKLLTIYNYIWKDGTVWKLNAKDERKNSVLLQPDDDDADAVIDMDKLEIPFWFPENKFPNTPSINGKFIKDIGGDNFSFLWTRRNLYLLALLFDLIEKQDKAVQLPLLYAFVHTLHLVSKMVVSRQERGNRAYSGSWGRADYMIRNRRMEQNPVIVFFRACFDKQGVVSALTDANERLGPGVSVNEIGPGKRLKSKADINYGRIDISDLLDHVPEKSVDFIITDPPYGGLVQYMDLSMVWLVWLMHHDERFTPDMNAEITVKKGVVSRDMYRRRLQNAFVNMHKVLKDDGYMVVTFHSKEMQEWNDFVNAVRNAGFKFDKITHQYNRRSGESNVSNPYGTAGSDFYIRCVKKRDVDFSNDRSALEHFVFQKTTEVVARRAEPTPYDFILNSVLPEMLQAGFLQPDEPAHEINKILKQYTGEGKTFSVTDNPSNKAGAILWFNDPSEYISFPDIPLSDRVDEAVLSILRRRISVRIDDVIAELFKMYPNGLTPDPRKIKSVMEKYAFQSSGKWKLKDSVSEEASKHTQIIGLLCKIGKKLGYGSFVGQREQPEYLNDGQRLRDIADIKELSCLSEKYEQVRIERISMVDCVYISGNEIMAIFEVENSTNFSNAIIRASNVEKEIRKFMIIPDDREDELRATRDPMFVEAFSDGNWRFLNYTAIKQLASMGRVSMEDISRMSKALS